MSKSLIVDMRMLSNGGIGTYIREVMPEVLRELKLSKLRILVEEPNYFEANIAPKLSGLPFDVRVQNSRIYSPTEQAGYLKNSSFGFDDFFAPHLNVPWFFNSLIVTIHDTFHLSRPDISRFHQRVYMRLALKKIQAHAKLIFTVSDFSKNEILRHADIDPDKINVVPHGYSAPVPGDFDKKKFESEKPFFLFVGNLKPHKNLKRLVDAFERIQSKVDHELWIAGAHEGLRTVDPCLENYRERLGERLRFLGRVKEAELSYLYQRASVFVAPSTYEGFGLTPIEARSVGARVLASDIPSHREFLKESVDYFNPSDVSELAEKLVKVADCPSQSKPLPGERSWDASIEEHVRLLKRLGY